MSFTVVVKESNELCDAFVCTVEVRFATEESRAKRSDCKALLDNDVCIEPTVSFKVLNDSCDTFVERPLVESFTKLLRVSKVFSGVLLSRPEDESLTMALSALKADVSTFPV